MKLSEFKTKLSEQSSLSFVLPNGKSVPSHFHLTEIGILNKSFIDCGGTARTEQKVTMQLWTSVDYHHRLSPEKMLGILEKSSPLFTSVDPEIEVEYQGDTIGKYGLDHSEGHFQLLALQTDCLAKDNCGIPVEKVKKALSSLQDSSCCQPGSGCC